MASGRLRSRFSRGMSRLMREYSSSLKVDEETVLEDVWCSQAHVIMLARQKIIGREDAKKILGALEKAAEEWKKGKLKLSDELEDIHMNIEAYVEKHAGKEAAGRMHTARSRNDQVATDTRLKLREMLIELQESTIMLQKKLFDAAEESAEKLMPGYTHTQPAQPITLGFWLTAHASMLERDILRLRNAYSNVNRNPLGACALAGTSFPIDRETTTKLLGFDSVIEHSLDAVSCRDHIAEAIAAVAILASDLSRLAEELILYSTREYNILELSDGYTTGSSIMPQKKNPDAAELARGMSAYSIGNLVQVLVTLKALPLGYNRDLQEDRVMLWETMKKTTQTAKVLADVISTARFNEKRMKELAESGYSTATELANYLVREGLPFRRAHEITASVVRELYSRGIDFSNIKETRRLLSRYGIEATEKKLKELLDPRKAVEANRSLGGTSPKEVKRLIQELKKKNLDALADTREKKKRIEEARKMTKKEVTKLIQ